MNRFAFCWLLLLIPVPVFGQVKSPFKPGRHGPAELKFIGDVPVLIVAGKPEEIGEQIGILVGKHSPDPTPILYDFLKEAKVDGTLPALKLLSRQLKPAFPPHQLAEIETISKVAGYELDLLLFINTVYDLSSGMGCSTFVIEKGRSATGQPLFGRNFDWLASKGLPQQSMVVVSKPTGKHAFATITLSPIGGMISGMNDAGLACTINAINLKTASDKSSFDWKGTPMLLLFRQVLEECTSVAEAEKFLKKARRTTAACLTVCDANGGAVFEITPKHIETRGAVSDVTCCTNHFCTGLKRKDQSCWRLDKLLAARDARGKYTVEDVFATLHAVNQEKSTIHSMVFEPSAKMLHLKVGDGEKSATEFKAVKIDLALLFSN